MPSPLSEHHANRVLIRGQNIAKLIGTMSFSELLLFSVLDAAPSSAQVKLSMQC